jgi:predicted membrane channel-forming protein YqfA (hemolysin III family)
MHRRTRRLIGTTVLIAFVSLYPLLVMVLVQTRPVQRIPVLLIYVVLGFCWILPIMPLIKWMERNDL